ncbi:MAG: hypothetical protein ACK4UT_02795 [Moraxellaceae bacterium]
MNKHAVLALVAAFSLAGCESSSDETLDVYRLKAVTLAVDGEQTGRVEYRYRVSGVLDKVVTYDQPGDDGLWGTADDRVSHWSECGYSGTALGLYRDVSVLYGQPPLGAAALAAWETAAPRATRCIDGLAGNRLTAEKIYVGKGADNTWFTADDDEDAYRYGLTQDSNTDLTWTWTTRDGSVTRYRRFTQETTGVQGTGGLRAIRFTEDVDAVGPYEAEGRYFYVFDTSGRLEARALFSGKGGDGVWGTTDDVKHSGITLTRSGALTRVRSFNSSDVKTGYYEYTLENGRLATESRHEAGPDGLFETADDVVTVHTFTYEKI